MANKSVSIQDKFECNVLPRPGYIITYPYVNEYHNIREYTKEQILAFRQNESNLLIKTRERRNVI